VERAPEKADDTVWTRCLLNVAEWALAAEGVQPTKRPQTSRNAEKSYPEVAKRTPDGAHAQKHLLKTSSETMSGSDVRELPCATMVDQETVIVVGLRG